MTELEQAEARLAELQGWLEAKIATRHSVALRDVLTTAIEVGRLRALAVVEKALTAIDMEIAQTLAWRANHGMRPATDTSRFATVPPSGLREIEWHIREARAALAAREEASE